MKQLRNWTVASFQKVVIRAFKLQITSKCNVPDHQLVLALLVTLVPLGVIIWVAHRTFVEQAERQVGGQLENSVAQVGKSMDEFMLKCTRELKSL